MHHQPVYCHPFISNAFECEKPQIGDSVLEGSSACVWGMVLPVVVGEVRLPVSKTEPCH